MATMHRCLKNIDVSVGKHRFSIDAYSPMHQCLDPESHQCIGIDVYSFMQILVTLCYTNQIEIEREPYVKKINVHNARHRII